MAVLDITIPAEEQPEHLLHLGLMEAEVVAQA
jgi:hypothetical protein